jgi:predicted CDP-diglyceride synthetase/phosphatidate cytidylyltransferase
MKSVLKYIKIYADIVKIAFSSLISIDDFCGDLEYFILKRHLEINDSTLFLPGRGGKK